MTDSTRPFIVETISTTHYRYLVNASSKEKAIEWIEKDPPGIKEFTSKHVGEQILSVTKMDSPLEELIEKHKKYCCFWMGSELINEVDDK